MENKEKTFISAVVYVHNASLWISDFMEKLIGFMENNFLNSEIICVNDNSMDDSVEKIKKAASYASTQSISIINMDSFHGLEVAMNAGVDLSIGDFVLEFDSPIIDFDINEIYRVYNRCKEGFDMVSAAPDRAERFSSKIFYNVFLKNSDLNIKMHTERFRIISKRLINRVNSMNRTLPYRKALYASAGLKIDTLKYKPISSIKSQESARERRYRRTLAIDSLILLTQVGYKFSIGMTIIMMLMSVFMVIYSIVIYATAHPVEGWTTTILFLSVAFFGLFGILTIIIKYLQLLINMYFKRKPYVFSSIEKLTK